MSARPSIRGAITAGLRLTLARPRIVAAFLLVNLLAAWVLAAPLGSLLSETLDHNLHSNEMATGASWRWFDEVRRTRGEQVGNLAAWHALFSDEGVGIAELRALSGQAKAVALAALFLIWIHSLLHCGFLATLYPDRRGGFAAATARFAFPATLLSLFACISYAVLYGLLYSQTGNWLAGWYEAVDSEWITRVATLCRLALTLAAFLAVKLFHDLTRVILVDRDSGNWPWAGLLALRDLARQGPRYTVVYLAIGLLTPLLALAWGWTGGGLAPQSWLGLLCLFLLHQAFLGSRIGLRLSHLAATRELYLRGQRVSAKAPFKVTRRGEAPPDETVGSL